MEDARIFDLPTNPTPILISAFGTESAALAAKKGDGLWTTGLPSEVIDAYRSAGGSGPIWSQLSLSWADDKDEAVKRAHKIWPNTALEGQLAQDLRTVLHFEQAVKGVTPEEIEKAIPCGPDPEPILQSISQAEELGIDHIYLHQIGDPTKGFIDFWANEIKPALA